MNARDFDSCTPLHLACAKGYDEVVETLIKHGADVNAGDKEGFRPLHRAAENGKCFKILPDHSASLRTQFDQISILLLRSNGKTILFFFQGHAKTVEILIENNANLNSQTIDRVAAIHIASGKGDQTDL